MYRFSTYLNHWFHNNLISESQARNGRSVQSVLSIEEVSRMINYIFICYQHPKLSLLQLFLTIIIKENRRVNLFISYFKTYQT